jgi:hypothetical protein
MAHPSGAESFVLCSNFRAAAGANTQKIASMAEQAKLVGRLVFVCDPLR